MTPRSAPRRALAPRALLALALGVLPLAGCFVPDTCTQGDTMTDPRAESYEGGVAPHLVIAWEPGTGRGADLPERYFAAAEVVGADADLVRAVEVVGKRRLAVEFADLSAHLADDDEVRFDLAFPDRRDYIACTHPASDDRYLLSAALRFDGGAFREAAFEQRVVLGPY